jgi:hypothetical protein
MAISRVWKIEGFDVRPTLGNMSNVVSQIEWSLTMEQTDNNSNTIIGRTVVNGGVIVDEPTSENFIPAEQLTETQLITWVKTYLGQKVKEYETQTFYKTVNQNANTFVRMAFDQSGNVISQS